MIEVVLKDYLKGVFGGMPPVYSEIPENPASEYIAFEHTGGSKTNKVKESTFAVQSVSTSLLRAAALNDRVLEAMELLPTRDEVAACALNSDYNFTDPETEQYRYQAVFNITHY